MPLSIDEVEELQRIFRGLIDGPHAVPKIYNILKF